MSDSLPEFNIVALIEENPIASISNAGNIRLLSNIQKTFTNFEQKLFISSFYCYFKYDKLTDYVISLDDIWQWLGFNAKYTARLLLEKHFALNIDYKCFSGQTNDTAKIHGGQNKVTYMLNVQTFKIFCIQAGASKSKEIHKYVVHLEELIFTTICEDNAAHAADIKRQLLAKEEEQAAVSQQLTLQTTKANRLQEQLALRDANMEHERELAKEQVLLKEFETARAVVYVIKVKTYVNKTYVVKIGESRAGIQGRYNEHKSKYEEVLLLACFAVKRSKEFENFIHGHHSVKFSRVTNLEDHETERELFLIGKKLAYKTLMHVITSNLNMYDEHDESVISNLQHENTTLKQMLMAIHNDHNSNSSSSSNTDSNILQYLVQLQEQIQELMAAIHDLTSNVVNLQEANAELSNRMNASQTRTTTNFDEPLATLGCRLLKLAPDTFQTLQIYESVAELLKESNFRIKRPSITKAVEENTIYHGHRWFFVDRTIDPATITPANIAPTKVTKVQNIGYVAKLNVDRTEIVSVYFNRKIASTRNFTSETALDVPVKKGTPIEGHYYVLYDACDEDLQTTFTDTYTGGKPLLLYNCGVGKFTANDVLIEEYVCKFDCIKQQKISDKTLAKLLASGGTYLGNKYKYLEDKLACP